METIDQGQKRS